MIYTVLDILLHVINIYYELKIIKLLNTTRKAHLKIRVFRFVRISEQSVSYGSQNKVFHTALRTKCFVWLSEQSVSYGSQNKVFRMALRTKCFKRLSEQNVS